MIYFVQAGKDGAIKIGYAKSIIAVRERIKVTQTYNPAKLKLLKITPGGRQRENEMHNTFKSCRIRGEWFHPNNKLLEHIKQLPRVDLRGRPRKGQSRPKTLGASTRLPEPVVLAIREEARTRGMSPSMVMAGYVRQSSPHLPWPEEENDGPPRP